MNTEERVLLTSIEVLEKKVKELEAHNALFSEALRNSADTYLEYRQTQAMLNQIQDETRDLHNRLLKQQELTLAIGKWAPEYEKVTNGYKEAYDRVYSYIARVEELQKVNVERDFKYRDEQFKYAEHQHDMQCITQIFCALTAKAIVPLTSIQSDSKLASIAVDTYLTILRIKREKLDNEPF